MWEKRFYKLLSAILVQVAIFITVLSNSNALATVYYAVPGGGAIGLCTSWINACDLQSAITKAGGNDEIWVQEGIHKPTTSTTDRTATFTLKEGIEIYGGFNGGETNRDQRDWKSNRTVLSGDIDSDDDTDTYGVVVYAAQINGANSYHVVTGGGTTGDTVLDGFIITAGQANTSGGGMYNSSTHPTLRNITFSGNSATSYGGGMYNLSSTSKLYNVQFSGNSAYGGGGMFNSSSHPSIYNAIFIENRSTGEGGGGMYNVSSDTDIVNGTFSGNSATNYGGGIRNNSSYPILANVIMWGDSATTDGQEIYNNNSTPAISWSDIQGCGGSGTGWQSGLGTDGGGNIDADPLFSDNGADNISGTADDSLRVKTTSPVIDAGSNSALPAAVTSDLDGKPRFLDMPGITDTGSGTAPIVDMGAYESIPRLYASPNGSGDCTSWLNSCTLAKALGMAANGNEIWTAKGVHKPTASTTDRDATLRIRDGFALYGGFNGTETSRDQRDWQNNITVLSGDIDNNDTKDPNGVVVNAANINGANSKHIVKGSYLKDSTIIDGFFITAGQENLYSDGGGMYLFQSSPTITNLTFSGNSGWWGGGMYGYASRPTISNVTFSGNSAHYGGGMFTYYSSCPTLTNVTFSENSADAGGGMYNYETSASILTNVTFSGNSANYGGGVYNGELSYHTLTNVTFSGNSATNYGGGMYNYTQSSPTLTNVTFSGNSADNFGGGMYNGYVSRPSLTNVTFSENSADYGGGMYNYYSYSYPTLANVIMWGNSAETDGQEIYNDSSNPTISYSSIQGCGGSGTSWQNSCGTDGGHNIDADPRFVDADGPDNTAGTSDDNLRLKKYSPAIDKGDNSAVPPGVTTDLDGNPRIVKIVDMGAYEAPPSSSILLMIPAIISAIDQ